MTMTPPLLFMAHPKGMLRIAKDLENLKKLNNLFLAPLFINDDPFIKVL